MIVSRKSMALLAAAASLVAASTSVWAGDRGLAPLRLSVKTVDSGVPHLLFTETNWGSLASYQQDQGLGASVLTLRPRLPLLCADKGTVAGHRRVAIDPNGYLPASASSPRAAQAMAVGSVAYALTFDIKQFNLEGLNAYCIEPPAVDQLAPTALDCGNILSDQLFVDRFDEDVVTTGDGVLQFGVKMRTIGTDYVEYEYILRAVDGPVFDVQFREQFPYHLAADPSAPLFQRSLALDRPYDFFGWKCERSDGAICDANAISTAGRRAGYASLDGGRIEAGACLKISAMRPTRANGLLSSEFSGRMFGAAFYSNYNGQGLPQRAPSAATRIRFTNP